MSERHPRLFVHITFKDVLTEVFVGVKDLINQFSNLCIFLGSYVQIS